MLLERLVHERVWHVEVVGLTDLQLEFGSSLFSRLAVVAFEDLTADLGADGVHVLQPEPVGEVLPDLRDVASLRVFQGAGEDGVLASQVLRSVVLGESDLDVEAVTHRVADDLRFEAGNELPASDHDLGVLGRATLEGFAVDGPAVVDDRQVAVGDWPVLDGHPGRDLLLEVAQLVVDRAVANGPAGSGDLQPLVRKELDLGEDLHRDAEAIGLALRRRLGVDVRGADGDQRQVVHRARPALLHQRLGRVGNRLSGEALAQMAHRHPPATKARQGDPLSDLVVDNGEVRVDAGRGHGDAHALLRRTEVFDFEVHVEWAFELRVQEVCEGRDSNPHGRAAGT